MQIFFGFIVCVAVYFLNSAVKVGSAGGSREERGFDREKENNKIRIVCWSHCIGAEIRRRLFSFTNSNLMMWGSCDSLWDNTKGLPNVIFLPAPSKFDCVDLTIAIQWKNNWLNSKFVAGWRNSAVKAKLSHSNTWKITRLKQFSTFLRNVLIFFCSAQELISRLL